MTGEVKVNQMKKSCSMRGYMYATRSWAKLWFWMIYKLQYKPNQRMGVM